MKIIPLYRIKRPDGGVTDTPIKPDGKYTERVRLVAGKGKLITKDGVNFYTVKDENSADGWYEVDAPESTETEDGNNAVSDN
jgi:hypothetical protein